MLGVLSANGTPPIHSPSRSHHHFHLFRCYQARAHLSPPRSSTHFRGVFDRDGPTHPSQTPIPSGSKGKNTVCAAGPADFTNAVPQSFHQRFQTHMKPPCRQLPMCSPLALRDPRDWNERHRPQHRSLSNGFPLVLPRQDRRSLFYDHITPFTSVSIRSSSVRTMCAIRAISSGSYRKSVLPTPPSGTRAVVPMHPEDSLVISELAPRLLSRPHSAIPRTNA
jgi:hypothetical protein